MYRFKAEVIRACFVIIIKIYKVTNLSFLIIVKSTIRYLPLRCSGVEVKSIKMWNYSSKVQIPPNCAQVQHLSKSTFLL